MKSLPMRDRALLLAPVLFVTALVALCLAIPALASSTSFSAYLPAYQGNVTLATGKKSSSQTTYATVNVTSDKNGGIFWCDKGSVGNRCTNSYTIYRLHSGALPYYVSASWTGNVVLRACAVKWIDAKRSTAGTVNFG